MSSISSQPIAATPAFIITDKGEAAKTGDLPRDFKTAKPHMIVSNPQNVVKPTWTTTMIVFTNDMEDQSGDFIYQSIEKTAEKGNPFNYSISSPSLQGRIHTLDILHNCDITLKAWYRTKGNKGAPVDREAAIFVASGPQQAIPKIVQLKLSEIFKDSVAVSQEQCVVQ